MYCNYETNRGTTLSYLFNTIGPFEMVLCRCLRTTEIATTSCMALLGKTRVSGFGSGALERLMLQFQLKLSWVPDVVAQIITLYLLGFAISVRYHLIHHFENTFVIFMFCYCVGTCHV